MPIIIFIILVILVEQVGFWDTFAAVLGALGVMLLFILLAALFVVLAALYLYRRATGSRRV